MSPRPILVLGAERCGATLVAELIACWGARRCVTAAGAPQELMTEALAAAGGVLWSSTLAGRLGALAEEPAWRARGLALAAAMAAGGGPWFWQVPFPMPLIAFWERLWPAPILVVVVRNPLDSAASFAKARLPEKLARIIRLAAYFGFRWQVSNLVLLELCERHPDHLLVDFDQLLKAPVEQVRRLGSFLDAATLAAAPGDERLLPMLEAADPGLWHCKSGNLVFELPQVIEEQKELLRYLRRRCAGTAEPFAASRFPVPAYAWEYLHNFELYFTQQANTATAELAAAGSVR